ncbi:hypothetical protein AVEN_122389-1 [Araneus ventricosus]|uniref:Uncharacterized protein n=1 Tax=Araneus ventricosus TaxID=182803 RepID=A0A4Y2U957_ARAVE|nr:hypothetical protein AVEN_122389-1 [Araneus ventricosus]
MLLQHITPLSLGLLVRNGGNWERRATHCLNYLLNRAKIVETKPTQLVKKTPFCLINREKNDLGFGSFCLAVMIGMAEASLEAATGTENQRIRRSPGSLTEKTVDLRLCHLNAYSFN